MPLFPADCQICWTYFERWQTISDPSKVESIKEWEHRTITTPKGMKGFLGQGWYQIYIKDFAKRARPLMESLQGKYKYEANPTDGTVKLDATGLPKKRKRLKLPAKEMKIEWTKEMIDGFEKLKQSLIDMVNDESKGLCVPQRDGKWLIRCDASDFAVGGALGELQPDGTYRPVALYGTKLQGERAGTTKDGFTRTKHTGQYGWAPREKETYAIVSCLLKFQSWIGGQEVTVQTDHSAIVKWYKEDLCTILGPLGRQDLWHEFLSRFNLMIEYTPGPENHVGDALSRWAYRAGTAQDTNCHGSDQDLVGWEEDQKKERDRIRDELKNTYPEAFTAINARQWVGCNNSGGKSPADQTGTEIFSSHALRDTCGLHGGAVSRHTDLTRSNAKLTPDNNLSDKIGK